MLKKQTLMFVVAMAVVVLIYSVSSFAADAAKPAAAPAPAPAAKPAPPAPGAHGADAGVPCVVTGKIDSKMVKNKKGEEVKRCVIDVAEAKGADGKAIASLKGKSLTAVGPKAVELEKSIGKSAEVTGKVVDEKRIRVESVK